MSDPQRRRSDKHGWRRFIRENAYRDVWLLLITGVALLGVWKGLDATSAIQQQRVQAIRAACEAQNARHDRTLATLDAVLFRAERKASAARLVEIKASRASTILLINALAPKMDCTQLANVATGHARK